MSLMTGQTKHTILRHLKPYIVYNNLNVIFARISLDILLNLFFSKTEGFFFLYYLEK